MSYTIKPMDSILLKKIQTILLRWFEKKGRDLPWRKTRDPYAIWVSEIMLQQTQVATVIPYYQRFLESFPTVDRLAKSDLSKVLRTWEGLGYYSRVRNLHRASKIVLKQFKGKIPDNLSELLSLPGIGKSTAGAILSIAHNKEAPILDGNVKRVLARLFAVSGNVAKGRTESSLWHLSEFLVPKGKAREFNQGLMDLGAMICTHKDPLCNRCPLRIICKGRALGNPTRYPSKGIRKNIPHVVALAAVIWKNRKVLLNQRPPKGLLGGLWEFPNWRNEEKGGLRFRLRNYIQKEMGMNVEVKEFIGTFKQTYSHFKLMLHVFNCNTFDGAERGRWVPIRNLHLLPMSRIHRRIANVLSADRRYEK
ncbi:MAG: A/G-specific adenine glycosylase [Thermodesulfobacteriota bacterium]